MDIVFSTKEKLLVLKNKEINSEQLKLVGIYIGICNNMIQTGKINNRIIYKINSIINEIENCNAQ